MITEFIVCILAGLGAGLGTGFAGMSAAAVISPITVPHRIDWITRVFLSTAIIVSFVVMTGFTINLMPSSIVITVEKPPIAFPDTKLDR